ncbi:hypothetical protein [Microcoleus sp. herbarium14]|uniref:hypothetical protein n=1 Tax=Microcoleus sp. herbarium14 TaxID=3055439 RepID=UPI002FD62342
MLVSDRAIDLILSAVRITETRNAGGAISKIQAEADLSGKMPIILAVQILSKRILSRLIRLNNPRNPHQTGWGGFANLHN